MRATLAMTLAFSGAAQAATPQWSVEFATGVSTVGGASTTTCAVVDGALKCWGNNNWGQIGDGTIVRAVDPVTIFAQGASAAAGGFQHTCSVISGAVHCWGDNAHGQLGNGSTTASLTPVATSITAGATAITSKWLTSCALVDGAAKCWGNNMFGQVGNGTVATTLAPVTVIASGVTAVAAGTYHSCALVGSAVQCWGRNEYGQLGSGLPQDENEPRTVIASGATAIALGNNHTCAVVGGAVKCWGYNNQGQVGDGSTTNRATPVSIIASGATAVTAGDTHTCALVDGALQCWGLGGAAGTPAALGPQTVAMASGSIVSSSGTTRIIKDGVMSCTGFCAPLNTISFELAPMAVGTDMLITATSLGQVAFASTTPSVCTMSAANKVTPVATGTCTIVASSVPSVFTRTADPVSRSTNVKASQSITFADIATLFTGAGVELSATASSGLPVAFASITPDYCAVSGTTLTGLAAGTCQVTASQQGDTMYAPAQFVTRAALVQAKYTQSIYLRALPTPFLVGTSISLYASADSGLPVTLISATPTQCSVSGTVVTALAGGTCQLTATQQGDAMYAPAAPVTKSGPVLDKYSQTISLELPDSLPLGLDAMISFSASSNLAVTVTSLTPDICTLNDTILTPIATGTCTLSATQGGDATHAAAPDVTRSTRIALLQELVFEFMPTQALINASVALSATASSGLPVTFTSLTPSICTVSDTTLTTLAAGICEVGANQQGDAVYAPVNTITYVLVGEKYSQNIWLWFPDPLMVGTTSSMFVGASSDLPVTLTSRTPDVCTIGTYEIVAVAPGTCTVVASQAGDANFFAAADETYSTTVVTEEMMQSTPSGMARPERQSRQKAVKK